MDGGEPAQRPQPGIVTRIVQRRYGEANDLHDRLTEEFDSDPSAGWLYGVFTAAILVGLGLWILTSGRAWIPNFGGRGAPIPRGGAWVLIEGPRALWGGGLLVCAGLLLHFHSFWGTHRRLVRYHEIPWFATLAGTLFVAAMFAYHVLRQAL